MAPKDTIRAAQWADVVGPLVGNLLDHWRQVSPDVKYDLENTSPAFVRAMHALDRALPEDK